MTISLETILKNIDAIKKTIHIYETRYGRKPNAVSLLAVSKNQSLEKIQDAISAGQFAFGENYIQEALEKITALSNQNLEWHFIGPIQSNKTKFIAEYFSWVHSVSDIKSAKRLNDQRPVTLPPLNVCIQINISREATKSGIFAENIDPLVQYCASLPRLKLRGLMALPAPSLNLADQRAEFAKLSLIYNELNQNGYALDTLSMGTSDDLEAAIAEGSTMVRVGTAIFGKRS